ncbi:MAG: hypothetical protein AB7F64_04390 [Gammaproteobacteria bacterium]
MSNSDIKYQYWLNKHNEWPEGDPKAKAIRLLKMYTGEEGFLGSVIGFALFHRRWTWRHNVSDVSLAVSEFEAQIKIQQDQLRKGVRIEPSQYLTAENLADMLKQKINLNQLNKDGDFYALAKVLAEHCNCVIADCFKPDSSINKLTT